MKTLVRLSIAFFVLSVLSASAAFAASHYWSVDVSTPRSVTNKDRVQLDFTTLSTNPSDEITLELDRNGSTVDDMTVTGGDSGRLTAKLPSDGTYNLRVEATNGPNGEPRVFERTITRDTTPPDAPEYIGAARSNGQYTVSFAASDDDTDRIYLFSSTSSSFTANSDTLVDSVSATGAEQQLTYSAATDRFHAVIAVDAAGNISTAVGDPDIDVDTIEEDAIPTPDTAAPVTAPGAPGADDGTAEGDDATEDDEDILGAEDNETAEDEDGEVAGEVDEGMSAWWWLLLVAVLGAAGYLYYQRRQSQTL